MKILIVILIITAFLQSTIIPLNLVLIILICRAYVTTEKANLYLAFSFGLLTSHLDLNALGFQSIIYLIIIQMTQILSKSRLATNYLTIVPVSLMLLTLNMVVVSFFTHQSISQWSQVIVESFFALPIYYSIRLWEEKFVVRSQIKLKV